jgi:glycosyltransferase involved in cell wall biosynthesis
MSIAVTMVTPGFRAVPGGVESHTSALTKELSRQRVKVLVLTAQRGITRTLVHRYDDCWVVSYPAWSIRSMSISPRLAVAAIRSRRSGRLMHVHSFHATTALAVLGRRTPTVFTPHYHGKQGHSFLANLLHLPYHYLGKVLFRRCDAVICVSDAERDALVRDFPFVAGRVSVIPNGADVATIQAAEPYLAEPPTVLCVGRLEAYKRVDAVVRAFVHAPKNAQLVVIGKGPAQESLEALAVELGVADRTRVLGRVDDEELHRWMRTAHVLVSMSEREAFGMAPIEAACAGARIILSDIPAHRDVAAKYLAEGCTVIADPTPGRLGEEMCRQLAAPRSTTSVVPDWRDVVERTVEIYSAAGYQRPALEVPEMHYITSAPRADAQPLGMAT